MRVVCKSHLGGEVFTDGVDANCTVGEDFKLWFVYVVFDGYVDGCKFRSVYGVSFRARFDFNGYGLCSGVDYRGA